MLDWLFGVKCPLSLPWQVYVESTLSWLEQHLPLPSVANPVRPDELKYDITDPIDQVELKKQICASMQVDPQMVKVLPDKLASELNIENANPDAILLEPAILTKLTAAQLVSDWAVVVAHCMLSNHGLNVEDDDPNVRLIAELAAIHCGWGIFVANGGLTAMKQGGDAVVGYTIFEKKLNDLTAGHAGYALAVLAWRSGMQGAQLAKELRDDAGEFFRQGLKYLNADGDHCYEIEQSKNILEPIDISKAIALLGDDNLPQKLFALNMIRAHGEAAKPALKELIKHLDHHQVEILSSAILCLKEIGPPARIAIPTLIRELSSSDEVIRAAAASAIGSIGGASDEIRLPLLACLKAASREVVYEAAVAIQTTRVGLYSDTPQVLAALRTSFISGETDSFRVFIELLSDICPNSDQVIFETFADDPDLREFYLELIAED